MKYLGLALALTMAGFTTAHAGTLPREVVAVGLKTAECDMEVDEVADELSLFDLGEGRKLVEIVCWRAAYQAGTIFFLVEPGRAPRLLQFAVWGDGRFNPSHSLTSADFDAKTKTLSSFHKGRGMGDCGEIGQWVWSGAEFRMKRYWSKPECDGEPFETEEADRDRYQVFPKRR